MIAQLLTLAAMASFNAASFDPTISTPIGSWLALSENECSTAPGAIYCQYGPVRFDQTLTATPDAAGTPLSLTVLETGPSIALTGCVRLSALQWVCEAPDVVFADGFEVN